DDREVAGEPAHPAEDVPAAGRAPPRDDEHPRIPEPDEVRALPDVRGREAGGDRVVDGEERSELAPAREVLAVVDEDARRPRALRMAGALDGVAVSVHGEDERVAGMADRRVGGHRSDRLAR